MELDDELLNETFIKVKGNFKGHRISEKAFYDLRDEISHIVKNCSNNVKVLVYFDFVLERPISVKVGKAENRLRITIKDDGRITLSWTKETWSKYFSDVLDTIKCVSTEIARCIARVFHPSIDFGPTKKSKTLAENRKLQQ